MIRIFVVIVILLVGCSNNKQSSIPSFKSTTIEITETRKPAQTKTVGQIYLYGESHGVEIILNRELELWTKHYKDENMRHLFIEMPYYTAEFLNIWMKQDKDDIFDMIYKDWEGTASYNPAIKDFYKNIKINCPGTIFHGTDVGHQYDTTGKRFLKYLESNSLKGSDKYLLSKDIIEQGKYYYSKNDDTYRENKMVENFIREYDKLNGVDIMGIYGGAHIALNELNINQTVPTMANQLKQHYGDHVYSEDLRVIVKDVEPISIDTIKIGQKDYKADYFGKQDINWSDAYIWREFWRLENGFDDFKDKTKTGDVLPYDNYPINIKTGQVFIIDYTKKDGSIERRYYRSAGNKWQKKLVTEEFIVE